MREVVLSGAAVLSLVREAKREEYVVGGHTNRTDMGSRAR